MPIFNPVLVSRNTALMPCSSPRLTCTSAVYPGATTISFHSDTELFSSISLDCFEITDSNSRICSVTRIDSLNFRFNCDALKGNDVIAVRALPHLYVNRNGESNTVAFTLPSLSLEELYGLEDTNMLYAVNSGTYINSGTYKIPMTIPYWAALGSTVAVTTEGVITLGTLHININARNSSLLKLSYYTIILEDDTEVLKIRWHGLAKYNDYNTVCCWELYFLPSGAITLYLVTQPDSNFDGTFNIYQYSVDLAVSYTISSDNPFVSFYKEASYATQYYAVNDKYDPTKDFGDAVLTLTLAELLSEDSMQYMNYKAYNSKNDDGSVTVPTISWMYRNKTATSWSVSGNSNMSISGYSELVRMNRRDAAFYYVGIQTGEVVFDDIHCAFSRIYWAGVARYSTSTIDQRWELYLFANGDAMIRLLQKPASYWDGTFSFCGAAYTISDTDNVVSFYRQDAAGTSWTVVNEVYDINKSANLLA